MTRNVTWAEITQTNGDLSPARIFITLEAENYSGYKRQVA